MSQSRNFVTNVLLLIVVNLLIKPFWIFGIDRVVQNRLGETEYGFYFALFNFTYIFSIVLDFGINTYNNRIISRTPARLGEYVVNLFSLKLLLSFVYLIITIIAALLIFPLNSKLIAILLLLVFNQILLSVILYIRSNFTALHQFKTDTFLSVSDKLIAIFLCSYWLYFSSDTITIYHFILSQTAALFITAIIGLVLLWRQTIIIKRFWQFRFFKFILLKALPYALMALLMSIYYRIDAIMLEKIQGAAEVGIYAAAYRMLDAISQFGYLFSIPLLPILTRQLKNKGNISSLMTLSHQLMFCFSICSAFFCFAYRQEIILLLYHTSESKNNEVFGYLMLSFIPIAMVYVYGTLLLAGGKLKTINSITAIGVVINIFFNFILAKKYGALGAVAATAITQLFVIVLFIFYSSRYFSFALSTKELIRNIIFLLAIGILLLLLQSYKIALFPAFFTFGILALCIAFLLKIFAVGSIKQFIASYKKP